MDFSSEVSTASHDSYSISEQCLNESTMELHSRQFFTRKAISLPHAIQNLMVRYLLNLLLLQHFPLFPNLHFTLSWPPNYILKLYTKYKYSLHNQLPTPLCHVSQHHAFVQIRSVIEHYVCFGYHVDYNNLDNDLSSDSQASTILQSPEVISIHKRGFSKVD